MRTDRRKKNTKVNKATQQNVKEPDIDSTKLQQAAAVSVDVHALLSSGLMAGQ